MVECFRCSISSEKVRLFDGISGKGIVKICKDCYFRESIPLIKRPTDDPPKEADGSKGPNKEVYDRLSKMSGFDKKTIDAVRRVDTSRDQEVILKKIVDEKFVREAEPTPIINTAPPRLNKELIDHFNWIIMRARRSRKLTQKELAEKLGESEMTLKMAEQGVLPNDDLKLVGKLESFLGIKIIVKPHPLDVEKKPLQKIRGTLDGNQVQNAIEERVPEPEEALEEELVIDEANSEAEFSQDDTEDLVFEREDREFSEDDKEW